jgi:UPF0755 protein
MIDDLDLAFEEPDDRNRHRRRYAEQPAPRSGNKKKKKKKKKKSGGRSFLALFMVVLLLGALGAGAWYGYDKIAGFLTTPNYDSTTGVADVEVEIPEGANGSQMATALKEKDVVKSAAAFYEAFNADPKAKNIQPGLYKIRTGLSGAAAVTWLLDTKNRVVNGITVIEGRSMFETFKLLAEKTGLPEADFKTAAADPLKYVDASWFERSDGKKFEPTLEGFLYPDTYEFKPKATAAEIIETMVGRFKKVAGELSFVDVVTRDRGGIKPYEALIVASLAQAEAGVKADLPKVARVAYQRAYSGTFQCGCLQMDVTVNYNFERQGLPRKTSGEMTTKELEDLSNPYSRNQKGMIPTPINSPGKDALMGAMSPSPEKYTYFVAIDKAGNSAFATTYADHCKNIKTAFQNGVLPSSRC